MKKRIEKREEEKEKKSKQQTTWNVLLLKKAKYKFLMRDICASEKE